MTPKSNFMYISVIYDTNSGTQVNYLLVFSNKKGCNLHRLLIFINLPWKKAVLLDFNLWIAKDDFLLQNPTADRQEILITEIKRKKRKKKSYEN